MSQLPDVFHVDLFMQSTLMGRRKDCDVQLQDPLVSGHHLRITREQTDEQPSREVVFVYDLSVNGTFVNNVKIGKGSRRCLENGDHIKLVTTETNGQFPHYLYVDNRAQEQAFRMAKNRKCKSTAHMRYDFKEVIGTGTFSRVKRGVEKTTGREVAIKIVKKTRLEAKQLVQMEREIQILKSVKHPHVVSVLDVHATDKKIYLVLELVREGELFDLITSVKLDEATACTVARQLLDALCYLHSLQIAHRDLKPENILLDRDPATGSMTVKITDFGLATVVDAECMLMTLCGTPQYVAPEIIENITSKCPKGYGKEVDMWSLGVILYILLSGSPPFFSEKMNELFGQIQRAAPEYPPELWGSVSAEAIDLVKHLLDVDPARRYSAHQAMEHPWIKMHMSDTSLPAVESENVSENLPPQRRRPHSTHFSESEIDYYCKRQRVD
eukprot:CAMPEP_0177638032 /NCGR_PEP_ID=MMETSP0447-20121125/5277_1 /TAXON_ID=0 /ORGANISM="Stygamoeba regulata, Strain BSH-02190019" /LENGTH=440 /DNA_ID=CAMNT_0019139977 /DNA_START=165 /DNA_END=1487 /DNA_ORIENTATION=+